MSRLSPRVSAYIHLVLSGTPTPAFILPHHMCPPLEVERKLNVKDQSASPAHAKRSYSSDKVWTELRRADKFLDKVAYKDTRVACCKGHFPRPDITSGKIIRRRRETRETDK